MSFKVLVSSAIVLAVVVMGLLGSGDARAQDKSKPLPASQQEVMKLSVLQRISYDPKIADELELAPDQRKTILIAVEKYRDESRKRLRPKPGENLDRKEYENSRAEMTKKVLGVLSEKQNEKLAEMAKALVKKSQTKRPTYSREQIQESQKLSSIMSELSRLSYDRNLSAKLEITAEQRVEIREAQAEFRRATEEHRKQSADAGFDMAKYNQMMSKLMIDAQDILTPEQSEQLNSAAKLRRLKSKYGDEFSMVNGFANDFDLDAKQKLELKEKIAEARTNYNDKVKELRESTMNEIIRVLPKEHREEVREAMRDFLEQEPMKAREVRSFGDPFSR